MPSPGADRPTDPFGSLFGDQRGQPSRDDALVCERADLLCFYFNLIAENGDIPAGAEEAVLREAMHIGPLHLRRLDPIGHMPLRFAVWMRPVDESVHSPACDILIERDGDRPVAWMRPFTDADAAQSS